MGYIKEPKGVDFVVEPHVVTPEDWREREILVEDCGACYLVLRLNLTLRKASELMANGVS
jgi:hypothetical protein